MEAVGKTVLLVDDEQGVIDILRVNLEAEGYQVVGANDGEEALEKARQAAPDLIVLDVMMPRMNGWEVLRHLEGDRRTAGVPVVMLSVRTEDSAIMRALEQGAVEYLVKPFDPLEVVQKVKLLLEELDVRGRQAYRQQLMERRRRSMKSLDNLFGVHED